MSVIAVDLGGTKVAAGLVAANGDLLETRVAALEGRQGQNVGRLIREQISSLTAFARAGGITVDAVGVSVPGIYRAASGTVWAPNIPGWEDYPLRDELAQRLSSDQTLSIDSDRACYVLGEVWKGCARGCSDVVFLAVGTGIGAGILAEGRILRGHADIAGAIGWLALDRPFIEQYVECGCFEYNASGTGIANVARDLLAERPEYAGPLRRTPVSALTAHEVFDAYNQGDTLAAEVLDRCVDFWAMAVANVVSLFNPEIVVFGGGVFGPAARFLPRIHEEAKRWAQPISIQQVRLEASTLGAEAGLYGAARLALSVDL